MIPQTKTHKDPKNTQTHSENLPTPPHSHIVSTHVLIDGKKTHVKSIYMKQINVS
jgi:hypothetical protein